MSLKSSKSGSVVIVGGGFGGLTTAISLSSCKERPSIILIEPRSRFVFLPFLYELLSEELESWEVAPSYRSLLASKGVVLINGSVEHVDLEEKLVITSSKEVINYAQLVISTGSQTDALGVDGVDDHALFFHKYEDVGIVKSLIKRLNMNEVPNKNIVVVGGGPTGVELACKVADLLGDHCSVHLIELQDRVLKNGKSFNQEQIEQALRQRSVRLHLNSRVLRIAENYVQIQNVLEDDAEPYSLGFAGLIWTAGVKPSIPFGLPDSLLKDGRILINSKQQLISHEDVFSIGDIALDIDQLLPQTAQAAMQQGEHLAKNLIAYRKDQELTPFQFIDRGEMLSMGIGEATITGMGLTISGSLAFKLRRMTYLSKFPNFALSIKSVGSWLLSYGRKPF